MHIIKILFLHGMSGLSVNVALVYSQEDWLQS